MLSTNAELRITPQHNSILSGRSMLTLNRGYANLLIRQARNETHMTFGETISKARKKANLSQRELAARVKKEDGSPISPQYLNDIERDRRNPPPDHLIEQFAETLSISRDVLYHQAGEVPKDLREAEADEKRVVEAWTAFRRALRGERG